MQHNWNVTFDTCHESAKVGPLANIWAHSQLGFQKKKKRFYDFLKVNLKTF